MNKEPRNGEHSGAVAWARVNRTPSRGELIEPRAGDVGVAVARG